jgi:hypothetical protein
MRRRKVEDELRRQAVVVRRNLALEWALPTRQYSMIATPPEPFMGEFHEHVIGVGTDPRLYLNAPYTRAQLEGSGDGKVSVVTARLADLALDARDEKKTAGGGDAAIPAGLVVALQIPPSIVVDIGALRRITKAIRAVGGSRLILISSAPVMGVNQKRAQNQEEEEFKGIHWEFRLCSEFTIHILDNPDIPIYHRMSARDACVEALRDGTVPQKWQNIPADEPDVRKFGLEPGCIVRMEFRNGSVDQFGFIIDPDPTKPTPIDDVFRDPPAHSVTPAADPAHRPNSP